jgi:periplasmic protein TonB
MFDLTSGTLDRPFLDTHSGATVVSVTTHLIVLGSIAAALLFGASGELPEVPTMMAFVAEAPAPPLPPPPPPPSVRTQSKPQPTTPAPASGQTFAAPAEIPFGIQPEKAVDFDDEGGEVGGVPGGIPGGVVGGLLGTVLPDPAPPPPPRVPKRVGGDIQTPALIHRVEPYYPPIAVAGKVSGMVILEATVNEAGNVTDVTVLRSIPLLDKPAIDAVKQWRYQPLLLNGVPFPFILTVTLTFSLK